VALEGDGAGGGADSGVRSEDLSGVHSVVSVTSPGGDTGGSSSEDGESGELHLDGWYYLL